MERVSGPEHSGSGFLERRLATAARWNTAKLPCEVEEDLLPIVPCQQAVDDLASRSNDLTRHREECGYERPKFHLQHTLVLRAVFFPMTAFLGRRPQRQPSLEVPRRGGHEHIGPIAQQVVHRRVPRSLRQDVLLLEKIVGRDDDLLGRTCPIVREVKEIAIVGGNSN